MPALLRTRTLLALMALGGAIMAGCATDSPDDPGVTEPEPTADDTATATTTPTASPTPSPTQPTASPTDQQAFATCESEDYSIGYPQEWNVNAGDVLAQCRIFHPGEIQVERGTERDLHYAASLYIDEVPFSTASQPSERDETLRREETTIAGRDAAVIEERSSGEALTPEGTLVTRWMVDLDGRTLFAVTYSIGETDYDQDVRTLERMMQTLDVSG